MNKSALYASIALLPVLAYAPLTQAEPESISIENIEKLKAPPVQGDTLPLFRIADAASKGEHDLAKLLANGPVVITFYRGSWCPYCVTELSTVQKHLEDITSAGATVLAISPEKPSETADLVEQKELGFLFGTDRDNELATKLALSFKLDAKTIKLYRNYGIDLPESNDATVWELPIPATYIVDTNGSVVWSYVDEDYSKRPDYRKVVNKLREMQQED
jgi:peroxiredoxin